MKRALVNFALAALVGAQGAPTCPFQCMTGLDKIGVGVDMTLFTPSVQDQINPVRQLKQSVVNLTSERQSTWINPFQRNLTGGVWDQVSHVFPEQKAV
jgi:hypothetical protein